jgi:tryptophan-rich sensory protein
MLRAVFFGAAVSLTAAGRGCDFARVPLQPPDWVFRVVWPCLYVTTGAAWHRAGARADGLLGAITGLCCAWLVLDCLRWRRLAAVVLLAVAGLAFAAHDRLLLPLAAWISFAALLSIPNVQS